MEAEMPPTGAQFGSMALAHSWATCTTEGSGGLSCHEGEKRWLENQNLCSSPDSATSLIVLLGKSCHLSESRFLHLLKQGSLNEVPEWLRDLNETLSASAYLLHFIYMLSQ